MAAQMADLWAQWAACTAAYPVQTVQCGDQAWALIDTGAVGNAALPALLLLPGALGYELGAHQDSHSPGLDGLLEGPQYTRPPVFRDEGIPPVLLSGNHAQIDRWRRNQALLRTLERRPELLRQVPLSKLDRRFLAEHGWNEPHSKSDPG